MRGGASPTTRVRGLLFDFVLNAVVLLSPPPSKYFQSCLHDVAHVLACNIIFRQVSPFKVSKVQHPYPLLAVVVLFSLAFTCGLGLCLFLVRWTRVCDLLPKDTLPEDYLCHNLDEDY